MATASASPKPRKRDRLDPRKVRIKGKTLWQVELGGEIKDGKRHRLRKTFVNREEAETFSRLKKIERENRGTLGIAMPERLRAEALEASRILEPFSASLLDAAREFVRRRELSLKSETVKNALASFLAAKQTDGMRPRYLEDLRNRLNRFSETYGEKKVADLEPSTLDTWLRELGHAPLGRNTYRLRLHTFFEYCRVRGWLEVNPVKDIPTAKVPQDSVPGILSVEQVARLLETAEESTLPYLAIGAFCGLRNAELRRLVWGDIHWDEKLLEVRSVNSKTGSRRFVQIRDNLALWLAPYSDRRGMVCPPGLYRRLAADRKRAGLLDWPPNCLRHSFASYSLAAFRDPKACALEMGHTRSEVTFRHYRELVRPSEAERFWKIAPAVDADSKLAVVA